MAREPTGAVIRARGICYTARMVHQIPPAEIGSIRRRLPLGAEVQAGGGGVHFRVWAPRRSRVDVVATQPGRAQTTLQLQREAHGYFSGLAADLSAGARYAYLLDGEGPFPDPVARYQPDGLHQASEVIDANTFLWSDAGWPGLTATGQVLYELHIGTFTHQGTFAAAMQELPFLRELGVTAVSLMPVAEFPGRFGWGYDGVHWFAPSRNYGRPEDLRRLVDQAHAVGLGVLLDVVYNHFGPDGNYLGQFAVDHELPPDDPRTTPWGRALNYDATGCGPMRDLVTSNAAYWIDEFHFDGLRLDATHAICDRSAPPHHIVADAVKAAHKAAGSRRIFIVAEDDLQRASLPREMGVTALWNDDFHHAAAVTATGHRDAYYHAFSGGVAELLAAVRHGFLYQGQHHGPQGKPRGTQALDLAPQHFVHYLETHDQLANSARGQRLWQRTSPAEYRALLTLLLLGPQTPMLFQGQEFAASAPFLYFADHEPELARATSQGRRAELSHFARLAAAQAQADLADPASETTFLRCKLDHSERETHAAMRNMVRHLLDLRRNDPAFAAPRLDGALLGTHVMLLRFARADGQDRLVIVNFGADTERATWAEPLLAPPPDSLWHVLFSSDAPAWGGEGTPEIDDGRRFLFPGRCTVVLGPRPGAG